MLADDLKAQIEKATVTITKKGGRGVLVESNLVLTVAHCIDCSCEGDMAMGDIYLEEISTATGNFRLSPYAVEPCLDVAALGKPDNQEGSFRKDVDMFELFCEQTTPVRLHLEEFEPSQPFPVYIYTHEGKWVKGNAQQCGENAPTLWIEFDDLIKGGTSGSAIVNENGEIVALASVIGGTLNQKWEADMPYMEQGCDGPSPRPHLTLPVWVTTRWRRGS